ncbi:MAG: SPOR domain-containing protein [Saprospiraceae bacterium]
MNKLVDQLFNIIVIIAVVIICVIVFRKAKDVLSGKASIIQYEEEEGDLSYDGINYNEEEYDDAYYYDQLEEEESDSEWQYDNNEGDILDEKSEDETHRIMDEIVNEKPSADLPKPAENIQPKPAPTPKAPPESKPTVSSGNFLLIAGSFTTRANAEIFITDLKKKGYSPRIVQFTNSSNFRVSAADFNNKDDAKMEMNRLKNVHKVDCYITMKK